MKRLNILIVTRSTPFHQLGGMETVAWDLARAFAALGHFVCVLTTAAPGLSAESTVEGVRIVTVDCPSAVYSMAWWDKARATYLDSLVRNTDVVFSVSVAANSLLSTRSQHPHPIFIGQLHGTAWGGAVSKLRQRTPLALAGAVRNLATAFSLKHNHSLRMYDLIVAIGESVRKQLSSFVPRTLIGDLRIVLIENGVDVAKFTFDKVTRRVMRDEFGINGETPVVLSLCRLHPQKGLMNAIEMIHGAQQKNPRLVWIIAGDGPQEEQLRTRVNQLSMGDRVHFIGRAARNKVPSLLSCADLLLFPTLAREGLPISVLEALASGLPIAATKGACDEALPCVFFESDDIRGFERGILELARPTVARQSRVPVKYTMDYCVARYIELFYHISNARHAALS